MKADTRRRWSARDGDSVARHPSNKGNGMTYDGDMSLLICEHSTSRVIRERDGTAEVVASHFQGRELNSPNDIVVSWSGGIYFTDPVFGRIREDIGVLRNQELDFQGLFRVTPGGDLELLDDDYDQPNGLCFSPREDVLYVRSTASAWQPDPPLRSQPGRIGGRQVGPRRRHHRLRRHEM